MKGNAEQQGRDIMIKIQLLRSSVGQIIWFYQQINGQKKGGGSRKNEPICISTWDLLNEL